MKTKVMIAGSLVLVLVVLAAVSSATWADEMKSTSFQIESVTVTGPSTCSKDEEITVTVKVKVKQAGNVKVTLYEKDVLADDKIGTETIGPGTIDIRDWEKSVSFTFRPSKYEKNKTLEIYAKASDVKSNIIKVKCK